MTGCDHPRPTRIYLVRHGETEGNQRGLYLGWEDMPLSATGLRQAEWLAARLARAPVVAVLSSDLRRAASTALAIAAPHRLCVDATPALREINFGEWSGLTYDAIAARSPADLRAWIDDPVAHAPPGGETLGSLTDRVIGALPAFNDAVVVTHGGPIHALLARWTGRSLWEFAVPTGCLITVELDGERLLSYVIDRPLP